MKKLIIITIIFLNVVLANSQTKEIVLVIDTIEHSGKYLLKQFSPTINYDGFANLPKEIDVNKLSGTVFPNFISNKFMIHDTLR